MKIYSVKPAKYNSSSKLKTKSILDMFKKSHILDKCINMLYKIKHAYLKKGTWQVFSTQQQAHCSNHARGELP
jgi:hypothetical protein